MFELFEKGIPKKLFYIWISFKTLRSIAIPYTVKTSGAFWMLIRSELDITICDLQFSNSLFFKRNLKSDLGLFQPLYRYRFNVERICAILRKNICLRSSFVIGNGSMLIRHSVRDFFQRSVGTQGPPQLDLPIWNTKFI